MANSSIINNDILDNDNFISLPQGAKVLYFYCLTHSDSEGFFANKNMLLKISGSTDNDLEELIKRNYIINFNEEYVIKGWFILNKMRMSQIAASKKVVLRQMLFVKRNGAYTLDDRENSVWYPLFYEVAKRLTIPRGETMISNTFKTIYQNKALGELNLKMINDQKDYGDIDSNLILSTVECNLIETR